jgi:hypothetical protein
VLVVLVAATGASACAAADRSVGGDRRRAVGGLHDSVGGEVGWEEVARIPEKRSPATVVVADGRILLWGGTTHSAGDTMWTPPEGHVGYPPGYQGFFGDARGDGVMFDPATVSWAPIPEAPLPIMFDPVAEWTGTELLLWGNEHALPQGPRPASRGPIGALFDPKATRWRVMAPQDMVLYGEAAWTGETLVVVGTASDHRLHAASYQPTRDEWDALPDPPLPTSNITSVHALDGDTVIAAADQAVALFANGSWRLAAPSPFADRSGTSFTWTGSELLQTGGGVADGDTVPPQGGGVAYDPISDSWRSIEDAPATSFGAPGPRRRAAVDGDAFFLATTELWRYSSAAREWSSLAKPAEDFRLLAMSKNELWATCGRPTSPGHVFSDTTLARLVLPR